MRVISGTAKGKKLKTIENLKTRPTLDRVKESIFNILQFSIKDSEVLDLFSGSGALAIEALSRGAKNATLCDNSKDAINVINYNLEETKLKDKAYVLNLDFVDALKTINKKSKKFDIVFLDPPYKSDYIEKSIDYISSYNLLKEDGIIVCETDDKNKINEIKKIKGLEVYDERKYGIALVIFIRKG